jgi:hypothetical protein
MLTLSSLRLARPSQPVGISAACYSLSTEQVYVYWVRFFIRWSGRGGVMRHPRTTKL